jgi:hypothetical protein
VTAVPASNLARPDAARAVLLAAVIGLGLAVDQAYAWGQPVVTVVVAGVFVWVLWGADRPGRRLLLACLLFATLGEWFLSLVWGLYDYRLGNLPLFVPPGHALLLLLGMQLAVHVPRRVAVLVPCVAAPVVAWQAFAGVDRLGVALFAVFAVAMWRSAARRLYAVMFVLALAMEFYGTWLGNWRWRAEAPWLGLAMANPPLTAGAFYCVLDVLVMGVMRVRRTVW